MVFNPLPLAPLVAMFLTLSLLAAEETKHDTRPQDHTQWGRSSSRNNIITDPAIAKQIPIDWNIGEFDFDTDQWNPAKSKNTKWVARLGTSAFGNPVVANGKVFVGTNNDAAYLARFSKDKIDLGVLLCFDDRDGSFVWQYFATKLPSGDKHDFAAIGICSSPLVIGDRLWFVNNRCEVVCLDTQGFRDGENDGPVKDEANENKDEADVVWRFDMIKELGVSPLFMANCSVTAIGKWLLVSTSNSSDEFGKTIPNPKAPNFIILHKDTGILGWKDETSGEHTLHGQWSSPAYHANTNTIIFTTGDGWLRGVNANPLNRPETDSVPFELPFPRWRFDCNDKTALWKQAGRGNRNSIIATPAVHEDFLFIATGQSPELGDGPGALWCIDLLEAEKWRGDVSESLVFNPKHDEGQSPIPQRRERAADLDAGDLIKPNPDSALKWKYTGVDTNRNGKLDFAEQMHRSISTVAVKDGLVIAPDFSGIVHCVDAATGKPHWTHDMQAGCWGSPLIVGDRVYLGNDHGKVYIFALAKEKKILAEIDMGQSIVGTPIVAGQTLYIATKSRLFAIELK